MVDVVHLVMTIIGNGVIETEEELVKKRCKQIDVQMEKQNYTLFKVINMQEVILINTGKMVVGILTLHTIFVKIIRVIIPKCNKTAAS